MDFRKVAKGGPFGSAGGRIPEEGGGGGKRTPPASSPKSAPDPCNPIIRQ